MLVTMCITVYGQLVLKWQISQLGPLPSGWVDKLKFLLGLLLDPAIFSGFVASFLASFG